MTLHSHIIGFLEMANGAEQEVRDDITELDRVPASPGFPGQVVIRRQQLLVKLDKAIRIRRMTFLAAMAADQRDNAYPASLIFQALHATRHSKS